MAYDEGLAERIREIFLDRTDISEKKMFGGLCFMASGHMCCGIVKDTLMARVGPEQYDKCLKQTHVKEMDFTGKPMRGMVYISPQGIEDDNELVKWIGVCEEFVSNLPPK